LRGLKDLIKQLLHIEDTPERTAFAYALGIFLGFSPFLGFHTIGGIVIAFLFRLNRVAVLLGAWTNLPWWIIPYYTVATWVGMKVIGFQLDPTVLTETFRLGLKEGFIQSGFWNRLASQSELLLAFGIGSLLLGTILSLIAYPLSLRWIKFYRSKRKQDSLPNPLRD
jgi:uncharacterized protein (DUF2062 family)